MRCVLLHVRTRRHEAERRGRIANKFVNNPGTRRVAWEVALIAGFCDEMTPERKCTSGHFLSPKVFGAHVAHMPAVSAARRRARAFASWMHRDGPSMVRARGSAAWNSQRRDCRSADLHRPSLVRVMRCCRTAARCEFESWCPNTEVSTPPSKYAGSRPTRRPPCIRSFPYHGLGDFVASSQACSRPRWSRRH